MNGSPARERVEALLEEVVRNSGLELSFEVEGGRGQGGPELMVCFRGPDVPALLARNAELLLALEHVAAQALRLEPQEHERISFDAGGFKAQRERAIARLAREGVIRVRTSGEAYRFRPMNSRERRLLHLALAGSGLMSQSEGEGAGRHLVLHPKGS